MLPLPRLNGSGVKTRRRRRVATPAPSSITPTETRGIAAALLREEDEDLPEVRPFRDKEGIDYKSKDSFAPFQDNPDDDQMYLIDLIHIDGTPTEIADIKAICVKHKSLFKNELGPEPARIPPFDFKKVDTQKWKHFRNRTAPRVASTVRQIEIKKQIEAMLRKGIITPSDASYYSQVILAIKPDGTLRFCIDYRNLNEATESASWPIPNIKQMLYRLGAQRPDTFGVIDLTAGYHQAPITLAAQIFTAFITFMGIYQFTRLPFGPKMAPSYFQQMMASIVLLGLI
jgi:hypothetical protein